MVAKVYQFVENKREMYLDKPNTLALTSGESFKVFGFPTISTTFNEIRSKL